MGVSGAVSGLYSTGDQGGGRKVPPAGGIPLRRPRGRWACRRRVWSHLSTRAAGTRLAGAWATGRALVASGVAQPVPVNVPELEREAAERQKAGKDSSRNGGSGPVDPKVASRSRDALGATFGISGGGFSGPYLTPPLGERQ